MEGLRGDKKKNIFTENKIMGEKFVEMILEKNARKRRD